MLITCELNYSCVLAQRGTGAVGREAEDYITVRLLDFFKRGDCWSVRHHPLEISTVSKTTFRLFLHFRLTTQARSNINKRNLSHSIHHSKLTTRQSITAATCLSYNCPTINFKCRRIQDQHRLIQQRVWPKLLSHREHSPESLGRFGIWWNTLQKGQN